MNTVLPAGDFFDFKVHVGTQDIQISAFDFRFMIEFMRREEDVALRVIVQCHCDVRVGIDKGFDSSGFRFRKRLRTAVNIGRGVFDFGETDTEVSVEIDAVGAVFVVASVLSPEREVGT